MICILWCCYFILFINKCIFFFFSQAFREVGNVKNNKDDQPLGGKKSTVVPVEQFKTFSVYEDHLESTEQATATIITSKQSETTSQDVVDKENLYHEKLQQQQQRTQQHHNILHERR